MYVRFRDKLIYFFRSRIYNKENHETAILFKDTIIKELDTTLSEIKNIQYGSERVLEDKANIYSDEFIVRKLRSELEDIGSKKRELEKIKNKDLSIFRLYDVYRTHIRIVEAQRVLRNIKEYLYRIREDKLMHDIINK